MKTIFTLSLLAYTLGDEPLLNGKASTDSVKSFNTKIRAIKLQLQSVRDQVLNRPLQGRKRLDLLSSLEEDAIIGSSQNQLYRQLVELMASLEEDCIAIQNGNTARIKAFRTHAKAITQTIENLRTAFGISKVGKITRKPRLVSMKTVT